MKIFLACLSIVTLVVGASCGGGSSNPDSPPASDAGPDANPFTGECNPLAPHDANGCPPAKPKCSFSVIQVDPSLIVQTRCQLDGDITGGFVSGCQRTIGDPNNGNGYDTCAMDSGDPMNNADDLTYACLTRGDADMPTLNDRYCQQICDQDDPMSCDMGFNCTGISGVFDDVMGNVGFCGPTCDPRQNPNPDAQGVIGERCTIPGEYCTNFFTGIKGCYSKGDVTTWEPCQFLNDCTATGEGCFDFNQNNPQDLTCGLYCDAEAADPNAEAWNESQQGFSSCNDAMALSAHPQATSGSFACSPLNEIYGFETPPPALQDYDGVCHWCDPKGADAGAEPCCEMDMMGNKVPAAMAGNHCFGCFEKWGCPINTTAQGGSTKGLKATPPEGAEKGFLQRAQ